MKKPFYCIIGLFCIGMLLIASASEVEAGTGAMLAVVKKAKKSSSGVSDRSDNPEKTAIEKEKPQSDDKRGEYIYETLEYGIQEDRIKAIGKIGLIHDAAIKAKLVNS